MRVSRNEPYFFSCRYSSKSRCYPSNVVFAYSCHVLRLFHLRQPRSRSGASLFSLFDLSLRTADAFPVVASLPPKNSLRTADAFPVVGWREATTGNASTIRRLLRPLPLVKSFAIFSSTQPNHRAIVFA